MSSAESTERLRVVHLPVYSSENSYQAALMRELARLGLTVIEGGSGGRFYRTALRVWKADVFHFHWPHPYLIRPSVLGSLWQTFTLLVFLSCARARGCRFVWTMHNLTSHDRKRPRLEAFLTRRFVARMDRIIVHCHAAAEEGRAFFGSRVHRRMRVVPHGSYVGEYPNTIGRERARRDLGLDDAHTVFGFVGRILPYKGLLDLVAAFRALPGDARLVIAGRAGADDESVLRDAVAGDNRVQIFFGFVPDEDLQRYLNASDAMVFPFREILTSGSVILAMSFGRACVAPRRGCVEETLGDEGGILYNPQDPDALGMALRSAYEKRSSLPAMGRRNFERAEEWAWPRIASETLSIYKEALGQSSVNA